MPKITVEFDDGSSVDYDDMEYAQSGILEAHCEGVGVNWIEDDESTIYSCIWSVELQKES